MKKVDEEMNKMYTEQNASDLYNIVFKCHRLVFMLNTEHLKTDWLYEKVRDGKKFIQLVLSAKDIKYIMTELANQVTYLCTEKEFNKKKKEYSKKYNKTFNNGTIAEVVVKHFYNQRYTGHDTTPYYVAGDIRVNNKEIQIKYQNAQVASYDTIKKVASL